MSSHMGENRPYVLTLEDGVVLRGCVNDPPQEGPIAVFLHGFRSDIRGHKASCLADHAAQRGRPWLAFDLRGHGNSDGDAAAPLVSSLLADLDVVLARLAPRPVMLIGSSLGGWLAVRAAERHRAQVQALLLIAPAFNFIRQHFGTLPRAEQEQWEQSGIGRFDDPYSGDSYLLRHSVLVDSDQHDVFADRSGFSCPIVILHGDRDEQVPLAQSRRFIDELAPQGELVVIPGGDHRLSSGVPELLKAFDRLWHQAFPPRIPA
ncbi:MAG: alpha/beta hydrolase [Acidiferrobacteraceae bacterium]